MAPLSPEVDLDPQRPPCSPRHLQRRNPFAATREVCQEASSR